MPRGIRQCMGPEYVDLTGGLLITYKNKDFLKDCILCCAFEQAINSQHNSHMKETWGELRKDFYSQFFIRK